MCEREERSQRWSSRAAREGAGAGELSRRTSRARSCCFGGGGPWVLKQGRASRRRPDPVDRLIGARPSQAQDRRTASLECVLGREQKGSPEKNEEKASGTEPFSPESGEVEEKSNLPDVNLKEAERS